MSDELFDDAGPEARGQRGGAFEDQLVGMGETLGWNLVCRNVDLFVKQKPGGSRGIDVLWGIRNPQSDRKEGWITEAKCHETPAPSKLPDEIQTLHDKVARLDALESFRSHPEIQQGVEALVGGMVAHRSNGFVRDAACQALLNMELRNKQRGISPVEILFYGPDSLEALADSFRHSGAPAAYFWPPTASADGEWSSACPPRQVAAGLLVYETEEGKAALWWRDDLVSRDLAAVSEIVHAWGINVDLFICSFLDRNQLRVVRQGWDREVANSLGRKVGHLPSSIEARDLGLDRMNNFDNQWPLAA
jgi:hypothetical protein